MKKIYSVLTGLMMAGFLFSASAFAVTLSLVDKGSGKVDVVASDTSNLLGAAFTVEYDGTKLSEPTVDSVYFDTFTTLGYDTADGLDASGNVNGYPEPIVTNSITSTSPAAVKIAAARPTAKSAVTTLFTLTFPIKDGATGTASVNLVSTTMAGGTGGYTTGEKIDPLVGSDGGTGFTTLMTSATLDGDSVSVDISTEASDIDSDGDGYTDAEEAGKSDPNDSNDIPSYTKEDFNSDDKVDYLDLAAFGDHWLMTNSDSNWNVRYDLNKDNVVNYLDLAIFGDKWLDTK